MSFQIKSDRKESENKTIRFPLPLIKRIEQVIKGKDVSFSGFVIQACEYALHHMNEE
ncbi:MAG: hypothetical protein II787_01025 [Lachnospiraceae bacterium]|nr:hypothetical protein [Lachnospiraceae bacterium]